MIRRIRHHLTSDVTSFGGLKVIADRAAIYANRVITIINLILLINLTASSGTNLMDYLWFAIFGAIAFVLITVFDLFVIYPQEINFRDKRSGIMGNINKKLDKLLEAKQ